MPLCTVFLWIYTPPFRQLWILFNCISAFWERCMKIRMLESLCRILDFLITPQTYQQRFNTRLKRDDTRHGCRVGVGCVSPKINSPGVIRKTYIRNSESILFSCIVPLEIPKKRIQSCRKGGIRSGNSTKGPPYGDPFKNQESNIIQ